MSRVGNQPIEILSGVEVKIDGNTVMVKGPKGEKSLTIPQELKIAQKDNNLLLTAKNQEIKTKSLHGLYRSLINNTIVGLKNGFTKELELVGTGYRVKTAGSKISLTLGLSHAVEIEPPAGISFEVKGDNQIIVSGSDKSTVGQTAASIRAMRKPDPYKGKGIRYLGETVKTKAGKQMKGAA